MARLLLGVTGGIAAYKALELARLAIKAGHAVRVVQTESACRFVGSASFAAITGAPVLIHEWDQDPMRGAYPGEPPVRHTPLSHLELVARADVYLIAPASANTIAKLATGAADNLLTAAALACRKPMLVAPAMNDAMYEHAATQENLRVLATRGVRVLEPGTGALGSLGEWGVGRLPEPQELLNAVSETLAQEDSSARDGSAMASPLRGKRVLVTAGGTREPVDAVRYLGNRSSGRMGWAVAAEASRRGARVTVVAANVSLPREAAIDYVDVETAGQLAAACRERFAACDVLMMAAAVADFRPVRSHAGKLKKDRLAGGMTLELEPTSDVLAGLSGVRRAGQVVIGFAAEHGDGAVEYGRGKLERKGLDAIVVNDISRPGIGFEATDNEVTIITSAQERHVPQTRKSEVAAAILDVIEALVTQPGSRVDDGREAVA
ncbi:MAG: bifunctional phosphopantothenoylcysteine decarboxylase/phosphopantothenate--cysteine ligase CoaBC [Actinomycetota bacterium]|nr:bifunctional phosphopantothenoylcysteine decarboxylase/phosphopantothenate--cysteine ligase CoaBC [Actinomycetota bacterium]